MQAQMPLDVLGTSASIHDDAAVSTVKYSDTPTEELTFLVELVRAVLPDTTDVNVDMPQELFSMLNESNDEIEVETSNDPQKISVSTEYLLSFESSGSEILFSSQAACHSIESITTQKLSEDEESSGSEYQINSDEESTDEDSDEESGLRTRKKGPKTNRKAKNGVHRLYY